LSFTPTPTYTATINPELVLDETMRVGTSFWLTVLLCVIIAIGFGFRVADLGAESLSEDELNKLMAVADYRANGLTAANGEHPMLMKVAQTISVIAAEKWNSWGLGRSHLAWHVTTEGALRFPNALLGILSAFLLFLVVQQLFGTRIGVLAAALWSLDPNAIAFNRIAKEDTFVIFFFLLANLIWLRGQRVAESGTGHPNRYYWGTAAAFGAMLASKYLPHMLAISVSYYFVFQGIPATRWRLGRPKFLLFLIVMGIVFVLCNPAILLPATWAQMRAFAGEHRIGHDSYEFIGALYVNKSSLWFKGIPWYFYFAYILFKTPIPLLIGFIIGIPRLFSRKIGDGRYFVVIWLLLWFLPFSVLGGKFTRYFTLALPVVLMTAAIGISWAADWIGRNAERITARSGLRAPVYATIAAVVLIFSTYASASVAPHYRLYTSVLGGGWARAGDYFPHDEFYDGATRDVAAVIVQQARPGALVLTETPGLVGYYVQLQGRTDLRFASLSDAAAVAEAKAGDVITIARGRRYFSNERVSGILAGSGIVPVQVNLGPVPAVKVYVLDQAKAAEIAEGR
jgi:4-amino-4-deoxy-L-arabinose transferase-like glycosyltransferase